MSPLEAGIFGVGLMLVLSSAAWKARRRRQARALLRAALTARDPNIRIAAIRVVGDEGLARHAPLLLERVVHDDDPAVLAALAQVVADNQWEPPDNATLIELRLWAHRCLGGVPAITAGTGGDDALPAPTEVVYHHGQVRPSSRRRRRLPLAFVVLAAAVFIGAIFLRKVTADGDDVPAARTSRSRAAAAGGQAVSEVTSTVPTTTVPPTTVPPTTAPPTTEPPVTVPPATAPPATAPAATAAPARRGADSSDAPAARIAPLCGFAPGAAVDIVMNGRPAGTDIADARGCISVTGAS